MVGHATSIFGGAPEGVAHGVDGADVTGVIGSGWDGVQDGMGTWPGAVGGLPAGCHDVGLAEY